MQDLYTENYQLSIKEIRGLNKLRHSLFIDWEIQYVKIEILPQFTYTLKTIPIKCQQLRFSCVVFFFFAKIYKLLLQCIQ